METKNVYLSHQLKRPFVSADSVQYRNHENTQRKEDVMGEPSIFARVNTILGKVLIQLFPLRKREEGLCPH